MQNQKLKEEYEKVAKERNLKTNNVAVADFLKAPKIEEVNTSEYIGKKNDLIKIKATDDFKVKEVTVKIENANGVLIEEGNAIESGLYWVYTTKQKNADINGNKITIRVKDNPDNMAEKQEVL